MLTDDRKKLAGDYLHVVDMVVASMIKNRRLPMHIHYDDMYSDGMLGLMKAAEKHDEARGAKFSVYADFRIRNAIMDGLRDRRWASRGAVAAGDYKTMDNLSADDDGFGLLDFKLDENMSRPDKTIERVMLADWLSKCLDGRERQIVWLYYFEGWTLGRIGQSLGLTESRISQIHKLIVSYIRTWLTEAEFVEKVA